METKNVKNWSLFFNIPVINGAREQYKALLKNTAKRVKFRYETIVFASMTQAVCCLLVCCILYFIRGGSEQKYLGAFPQIEVSAPSGIG